MDLNLIFSYTLSSFFFHDWNATGNYTVGLHFIYKPDE